MQIPFYFLDGDEESVEMILLVGCRDAWSAAYDFPDLDLACSGRCTVPGTLLELHVHCTVRTRVMYSIHVKLQKISRARSL